MSRRNWRNVSAVAAGVAVLCGPLALLVWDALGESHSVPVALVGGITGMLAAAVSVGAGIPAVRGYRYALGWVIPLGLALIVSVWLTVALIGFANSDTKIGWPDTWGR